MRRTSVTYGRYDGAAKYIDPQRRISRTIPK